MLAKFFMAIPPFAISALTAFGASRMIRAKRPSGYDSRGGITPTDGGRGLLHISCLILVVPSLEADTISA